MEDLFGHCQVVPSLASPTRPLQLPQEIDIVWGPGRSRGRPLRPGAGLQHLARPADGERVTTSRRSCGPDVCNLRPFVVPKKTLSDSNPHEPGTPEENRYLV